MKKLFSELKQGVVIVFISRYAGIFFQIIFTVILARLLTPKEFGVVAIVAVFITFFRLLSEMGLGAGIVQKRGLNNEDISSLFILTIFIAILFGLCFYIFSYAIAAFYKNNIYINIGHLLCITLIFSTLTTVPSSILRKNKKFLTIGVIQIVTIVLSGIFGVFLAFKNFSYYALVVQSIINSVLLFISFYIYSGIRVRFVFSVNSIRKIFKYSFYQFLFNTINYFSRNLDNILIGKFLGPTALGFYDKAYKLMLYPVQNLTGVMSSVLHPVMAEYQDKSSVIYTAYLKILKILLLIGIPISIFSFFSAKEVILMMFGNNWVQSIPVFKVLALSIWLQMLLSTTGSIFQAAGRTDFLFLSGTMSNILLVIGMVVGMQKGITGVAIGIVTAFYVMFIPVFWILIKVVINQDIKEFFKLFTKPLIIGIPIIIILYIESMFLNVNIFISFFIKISSTMLVYSIGLKIIGEYSLWNVFKSCAQTFSTRGSQNL